MLKIYGTKDVEQRAEGAVVLRRDSDCRSSATTTSAARRATIERAALPGAQPERADPDDRRRRIHSVGVQRHRPLPVARSTAWECSVRRISSRAPTVERWMDWQQTAIATPMGVAFRALLTQAGEAVPEDQVACRRAESGRRLEDPRRAPCQPRVRRRRHADDGRHRARQCDPPLVQAAGRAARLAAPRSLVRPLLRASGLPAARRGDLAHGHGAVANARRVRLRTGPASTAVRKTASRPGPQPLELVCNETSRAMITAG